MPLDIASAEQLGCDTNANNLSYVSYVSYVLSDVGVGFGPDAETGAAVVLDGRTGIAGAVPGVRRWDGSRG